MIGKTYTEFSKEPSIPTLLAELRFARPTSGPHEGQLMLVDVTRNSVRGKNEASVVPLWLIILVGWLDIGQ